MTESPPSRPLLLLHGNGFPSRTYRQFQHALQAWGYLVDAPPVLDTPGTLAAHERWPHLLSQVQARIDALQRRHPDQPLSIVGHSMGGYLAVQAAASRLPHHFPMVLIDAPMVHGWRGLLLGFAQLTGLAYRLGPAPIAARRRDHWPDAPSARQHFAGKGVVRRWADGVLDDYLDGGLTATAAGEQRLTIPRLHERDMYAHLPYRRARAALHQLQAAGHPPGFVYGTRSRELAQAGMPHNLKLFGPRAVALDTGHLIPFEQPDACAQAVDRLLSGMRAGA